MIKEEYNEIPKRCPIIGTCSENVPEIIYDSIKQNIVYDSSIVEEKKDKEPRCPVIESCSHNIKREEYDSRCTGGCHRWGNCPHLPIEERRKYRNKYFKKPKDWEKQEIAEKL